MSNKVFTPENISKLKQNEVFVFGSNKAGNHVGGAARVAVEKFGAIMGHGEGLQGQSYAIPTLDEQMDKVSTEELTRSVRRFADYTRYNTDKVFYVTKIGCGIAGFSVEEIVEVFKSVSFGSSGYLAKIESEGNNAVVAAIGIDSKIKAKKGSWITLAEYARTRNQCA